MPTEYIRVRAGIPEFVRSASFSHRHHYHHRRHRCPDDCSGVSLSEYNHVLEQNRALKEQNATVAREKGSLKTELDKALRANKAWSDEAVRLNETNARLSTEVDVLRDDIRRLCHAEGDHAKGFKRRIKALEKELRDQTTTSDAVIADLKANVDKSDDVANQWKRKYDELKIKYDTVRRLLFERDAQIERRNETIEEQSDTIRQLRVFLDRYRGW